MAKQLSLIRIEFDDWAEVAEVRQAVRDRATLLTKKAKQLRDYGRPDEAKTLDAAAIMLGERVAPRLAHLLHDTK